MENLILDGQAFLNGDEVSFHFESNILKLFFDSFMVPKKSDDKTETEDSECQEPDYSVCVRKRGMLSGGYYLMHMETPLVEFEQAPFPHTCSRRINWYIDSFDSNAKYHEMRFRFDELNYFSPSSFKMSYSENALVFDRSVDEILSFNLKFGTIDTTVKLVIYSNGVYGPFASASAKTISEVRINFEPTDDYEFFYKLFLLVTDTFSFVCNRRNLTLECADLLGTYEFEGTHPITSLLHVDDKYKEPCEESMVISKTVSYGYFKGHFGDLMQLIAGNYSEDEGTVSIRGLHLSTQQRNLIDLRQSLNITSAFEHHSRKYMPDISSSDTLQTYEGIKQLITEQYISTATGKKKKVAKQIVDNLRPLLSLGDKIKKAIAGYTGWEAMESIVSGRFPDWENLAGIANAWRNELAHEKREMDPNLDTIRAVRLVEHLNYAIILRQAGYSNEQIKSITDEVLAV